MYDDMKLLWNRGISAYKTRQEDIQWQAELQASHDVAMELLTKGRELPSNWIDLAHVVGLYNDVGKQV